MGARRAKAKTIPQPEALAPVRWPATRVEMRSIESLIPYARNARQHPPEQIAQIVASMKEFGFTVPALIAEDGTLIAGHGRILAARQLVKKGRTEFATVPVMTAAGWTDAQRRAYTIADNRLGETSTWDLDLLRTEMGELRALDFDLPIIGWDEQGLRELLAEPSSGQADPDDAPEPPTDPVSRLGDVWLLGKHRLLCGDSTKADDVARVLAGVKPHLMVTDPPYGVSYKAGWRNEAMPQKNDPARWKDGAGRATGAVLNDDRADWSESWALFPGDVAYVWHAGNKAHVVAESLLAAGLDIRAQIVWAKSHFAIGRGDYHPHHEPCWYAVRKGRRGHWAGDRSQTTLWQIDKPQKSETGHSTQKPVECMRRPVVNNSRPSDAVYEPFSGSGTTIVACEIEGRVCYAIELSPAYVDVAVKRWETFSGKSAELELSGRAFAQVEAERKTPPRRAARIARVG